MAGLPVHLKGFATREFENQQAQSHEQIVAKIDSRDAIAASASGQILDDPQFSKLETKVDKLTDALATLHVNMGKFNPKSDNPRQSQNSHNQFCKYCKKSNHSISSCWKKRDDENRGSGNQQCSYCKKNNHSADDCFKRQRDEGNNSGGNGQNNSQRNQQSNSQNNYGKKFNGNSNRGNGQNSRGGNRPNRGGKQNSNRPQPRNNYADQDTHEANYVEQDDERYEYESVNMMSTNCDFPEHRTKKNL